MGSLLRKMKKRAAKFETQREYIEKVMNDNLQNKVIDPKGIKYDLLAAAAEDIAESTKRKKSKK